MKSDKEKEDGKKKASLFKRIIRFPHKCISMLFKPGTLIFNFIRNKVKESIRFELIIAFGVCFFVALMVFAISDNYFSRERQGATIDYSAGVNSIYNRADFLLNEITQRKIDSKNLTSLNEFIHDNGDYSDEKIIITDLEGKIIFKTVNVSETEIDIYNLIKNASNLKQVNYSDGNKDRKEVTVFYPLKLKDTRTYLIVKGIPDARIVYEYYRSQNQFLALLIAVSAFILSFMFITNKKMKYIQEISKGVDEISKGKFSFRIGKKGKDELSLLACNINHMAEEIENKIESERKAEKTKSELITNVSHDLRTPLTSVMGYIGLVKDGKYDNEDVMNEYLDIAFNKAEKLKVLIEDLFEYTKLNNEGVRLIKSQINLNEFIAQVVDEIIPICDENNVEVFKSMPQESIYAYVDSNKMVRVFENLIINAVKYSYKPGTINIYLTKEKEEAIVCIENKGDNISKEKLDKLFDRFYRLDESRSASGGGSGLGLAIAKSIMEIHGGKIWASCLNNNIRFYISLSVLNVNNE